MEDRFGRQVIATLLKGLNMGDKIKWDVVAKRLEQDNEAFLKGYGRPWCTDPLHSAFVDEAVNIQPAWSIPKKIVISTAVSGAQWLKADNPRQPVTETEIRQSAKEVIEAGCASIHVHVREAGTECPMMELDTFHRVLDPLKRDHPEVVFDGCAVPALPGDFEKMTELLRQGIFELTPVNATATFIGDAVLMKPPHVLIEKTRLCQEYGVKPQIAVYSDGDLDNAMRYLIRPGLIEKPYSWCILPALPGCSPMHSPRQLVESLMRFVNFIFDADPDSHIIVCSAGRASSYLATFAMVLGLHVRVGMEDTIWRWPHRDEKIESNLSNFQTFKAMAGLLGRELATGDDFRRMVGLHPRASAEIHLDGSPAAAGEVLRHLSS